MDLTADTIGNITVFQKRNGYRFSIDALLLANFVNLTYPKRIADLGAGSGIVGITLSKRYVRSKVFLIEVQEELALLSGKSVDFNHLNDRVVVLHKDINNLYNGGITPNSMDLVVSNPPYRKPDSGKISPIDEKAVARHELKITLPEMIKGSFHLLKGKGKLCFIYHTGRFIEVLSELKKSQFEPKRVRFIHSDKKSESKMFLIEAVKEGRPQFTLEKPFFIYEKRDVYTEEASRLFQTVNSESIEQR